MTRDDVLEEILDEPKGTGKMLTSKLNTSPTGRISISIRLTPLNLNEDEHISPAEQENDGESKYVFMQITYIY